jgi:hypothetical protein
MTLQQLSAVKRWLVAHRRDRPVEYHTWDAVLTLWLVGCAGAPAAVLLSQPLGLVACVLSFFVPTMYVQMRLRLHRQRRLRCDWGYVIRAANSAN